mgnify:FL=1
MYAEVRSLIPFAFERRLSDMVIRMELFLEIYGSFVCEQEECGALPEKEALRDILYWYVSDYSREATEQKIRDMVSPESDFALRIIE